METFQVVTWEARDEDGQYIIHLFGRNDTGKPIHVRVKYFPCLFLKVRDPPKHQKEIKREVVTNFKSLWGYTEQNHHFTKIVFKTLEDRKWAEAYYKKALGKQYIFEANIDPLLRFMHRTGIKSTGWVQAPIQEKPLSWTEVTPVERSDIAPMKIMSFDIECYSDDSSFPDPEKDSDCVFQIAMSTVTWGSKEPPEEHILCISKFGSEKNLLEQFAKDLREINPDIITGWNIFGFDLEFLQKRLVKNKCSPQAYKWGRGFPVSDLPPVSIREKRLASNALGSNLLKMVPMFGRYVFDLFQEVKREQKYERYTLNHVSQVLLGDQKHDMPIKEMFERVRQWKVSGDPELLKPVADYCIKDTLLPHRIMDRLCTIPNLLEMAKATWVPVSWLSERGQQIKVFSQISKKALELNFMIPTLYKTNEGGMEDKYKGATVLDADIGAYYTPVTALDFASLYPSIMMAHNLCYSTIVRDMIIPSDKAEKVGDSWYVQNVPALLPEVLRELKEFRKQAKKDMAKAKGTPMEDIYNAKQLAYKISMNSVYGFTGASNGFLPMVEIASSVTAKGREMIQMTKELVEREFPGSKVRYGDSVMPETPVLTRDLNGLLNVQKIEDLGNAWLEYPGFLKDGTDKEQCELDGIEAWTHDGWKPIKRVIRHRCKKKIYRVLTHTSLVDVTEDHSLLSHSLTQIKPSDINVGSILYHSFPKVDSYMTTNFDGDWNIYSCGNDQTSIQKMYLFWRQLGYNVGIDETMTLTITKKPIYDYDTVKKISVLYESWDGYVYDLETEAGTFQAGVGQMIVKNTDSVMVEFDVGELKGIEAIKKSWELGEIASQKASEILRKPNELELEKVYCPYFLYSKKRYAAKKWVLENGELESKIDVKGLQVVRRDTCPFVRRVCKDLLGMILEGGSDPIPIIDYVNTQKENLLQGRVALDELVLTRNLAAEYKSDNLAHVKVRDKIKERMPGSEPKSGDRVPYVLLKNPSKKAFEKAEDPEFVREHRLELDYQFYYKNHFKKPVADLLAPIILL